VEKIDIGHEELARKAKRNRIRVALGESCASGSKSAAGPVVKGRKIFHFPRRWVAVAGNGAQQEAQRTVIAGASVPFARGRPQGPTAVLAASAWCGPVP
jgi:hypothetical protein